MNDPKLLQPLIAEYQAWNQQQGLALGSADEHLADFSLSEEQREWLSDYCRRWNAAEEVEYLFFLAKRARPAGDNDWGSERQIQAENRLFAHAQPILGALDDLTEFQAMKATSDEMIEEVLRRALLAHTLKVGDRVHLARDVDRYPYFLARRGATGTVTALEPNRVVVKMDGDLGIGDADEWDNSIIWEHACENLAQFCGDVALPEAKS